MTVPSEHCEVKLHGFRRTQDGVVCSFVINPVEVPTALALDPLGTRYMLVLARIGDDEEPVPPVAKTAPAQDKPRRRYRDIPASQRAGMLCNDKRFQCWVATNLVGSEAVMDADACANWLREVCGVKTRADIDTKHMARTTFEAIEVQYEQAVGLMPEPR